MIARAQLEAIESAISETDQSEQTTPAQERPEVLQALETAATVTRQAIEIDDLTARCESYMRTVETLQARCDGLDHELSETVSERDYYREAFFSGTRAAEAAERIITQWRAEAHDHSRNRPDKSSPPDDGERIPVFLRGGPAHHNVTRLR